jgi:hypothetical protein
MQEQENRSQKPVVRSQESEMKKGYELLFS